MSTPRASIIFDFLLAKIEQSQFDEIKAQMRSEFSNVGVNLNIGKSSEIAGLKQQINSIERGIQPIELEFDLSKLEQAKALLKQISSFKFDSKKIEVIDDKKVKSEMEMVNRLIAQYERRMTKAYQATKSHNLTQKEMNKLLASSSSSYGIILNAMREVEKQSGRDSSAFKRLSNVIQVVERHTATFNQEIAKMKNAKGADQQVQSFRELSSVISAYKRELAGAAVVQTSSSGKMKEVRKQIDITNKYYGKLKQNLLVLTQNEDKYTREIADTKKEMRRLVEETKKLEKARLKLRAANVDPMGKRSGGIRSGIFNPESGEELSLLESFTTSVGIMARFKSLVAGQIGTLMMFYGTIRMVTGVSKAWVRVNVELEDSIATLRTVVTSANGDMSASMLRLEKDTRRWALLTISSAKEVSDQMYFLASGGLNDKQISSQISGAIALSTSKLMENKMAAESVTTAYNLFHEEIDRGIQIADIYQNVVSNNQVTGEQIAEAMNYAGTSIKIMNHRLSESMAILGALGTLGIRGSRAGTSYSRFLTEIVKKEGQLEKIGINVKDLNGQWKSGIEILREFRKHYGATVDAVEQRELADLFQQRSMRSVAGMVEGFDTVAKAVENAENRHGAATKAMIEQAYSTSSMWKLVTSEITEFGYKVSNLLHPLLRELSNVDAKMIKVAMSSQEGIAGLQKLLDERLKSGSEGEYTATNEGIKEIIKNLDELGYKSKVLDDFKQKFIQLKGSGTDSKSPWSSYAKNGIDDLSNIDFNLVFDNQKDVINSINTVMDEYVSHVSSMKIAAKDFEDMRPIWKKWQDKDIKSTKPIGMLPDKKEGAEFGIAISSMKKQLGDYKDEITKINKHIIQKEIEREQYKNDIVLQQKLATLDVVHNKKKQLLEIGQKNEVKAVNKQLADLKKEIATEKTNLFNQGLNWTQAGDGTQMKNLLDQEIALKDQLKGINKKYQAEIKNLNMKTEKDVNSYLREEINNTLSLEKSLIDARYEYDLTAAKENSEIKYNLTKKYYEDMRKMEKQLVDESNISDDKKKIKKQTIDLKYDNKQLNLKEPNEYLDLFVQSYNQLSKIELKQQIADLDGMIEVLEAGPQTKGVKDLLDKLYNKMGLLNRLSDDTGMKWAKSTKGWKKHLDKVPRAVSLISDSIQSLNSDMDLSTKKVLEITEGMAQMGVGAATGDWFSALSGGMQILSAAMMEEKSNREEVASSVYELAKSTSTGLSDNYNKAEIVNYNLNSRYTYQFLDPSQLSPAQQESIAETHMDQIENKLMDRGWKK